MDALITVTKWLEIAAITMVVVRLAMGLVEWGVLGRMGTIPANRRVVFACILLWAGAASGWFLLVAALFAESPLWALWHLMMAGLLTFLANGSRRIFKSPEKVGA